VSSSPAVARRSAHSVDAQARPRPRVDDVGPEPAREGDPRVGAGVQGEPGEHQVGPPGVRQPDVVAVDLDGQLTEQAHPDHGPNLVACRR
jgi:hypothetical protein